MPSTTTIRVTRRARDLLAEQARARNVSITALVDELAHQAGRLEKFRLERELWHAEADEASTITENQDWDRVVADGLD